MASPYFSSDIIFEILTRTQLQTLGRCRPVCNEWNNMTYESSFTQLHCERSNTISGYFMQNMIHGEHVSEFVSNNRDTSSVSDMSLDFLLSPVEIEASCNQGLLFCVSLEPQSIRNHRIPKYYVCKPSTKQWQVVPNPKTKYFTERSAIMVTRLQPLHYNIVRFSRPKECKTSNDFSTKLRCEVFDSESWYWKTLKEIKLPSSDFLLNNPAISSSGATHWLTYNDLILTFHAKNEHWTLSPLPKPLHGKEYYKYKKLLEYEGQIALACIADSSKNMRTDLWVMDKKGENEWKIRRTFDIDGYPKAFYNADIVVTTYFDEVMFHKLQDRSCNVVKLEKIYTAPRHLFPYQSDLEPSNLRGGGN